MNFFNANGLENKSATCLLVMAFLYVPRDRWLIITIYICSLHLPFKIHRNQTASHAATITVIYPAFENGKAVDGCFFEHHEIAPLPIVKTYPVVLFQSSMLPPRSLFENPYNLKLLEY